MKQLQAAEKFISRTLNELGFTSDVALHVIEAYSEKNRTYHNAIHILEMYEYAIRVQADNILSQDEWQAFLLAIIFHDVVYNTKSHTNEEDSYEYFINAIYTSGLNEEKWTKIIPMIKEMILATKYHDFKPELPLYIQYIIKADLERLTLPFPSFWNNTKQLMKEYAFVDWAVFKEGRMKFFESYRHKVIFMGPQAVEIITMAHATLSVWEPRIGVMLGSWDPWHVGHQKMYDDACEIFDKVIIARGQNTSKPPHTFPMPDCVLSTCQVDNYSGSVIDYLNSKSYPVTLIRSIRNQNDLTNEIAFCQWIQDKKPEQKYIFLATHPSVAHVSSSLCREERKINGNKKTEYEL